jgi:hypothetical protein
VGIYRALTIGVILSYLIYVKKDIFFFTRRSGIYPIDFFIKNCKAYSRTNLFLLSKNQKFDDIILISFYLFGFMSFIGLFTNVSLIIFYFLLISIQQRIAPINQSGGDIVANIIILCLIFMDCGASLSVDSLFRTGTISTIDGWPMRLIQISISFGYFWSGIFKINSPEWRSGEALKNAMLFTYWSKYRCKNLFKNKYISILGNYSVVFFQFFAPILFWVQDLRPFAIIYGIIIHLLMIINLKIGYFGPIMIVGILSFAVNYFK